MRDNLSQVFSYPNAACVTVALDRLTSALTSDLQGRGLLLWYNHEAWTMRDDYLYCVSDLSENLSSLYFDILLNVYLYNCKIWTSIIERLITG